MAPKRLLKKRALEKDTSSEIPEKQAVTSKLQNETDESSALNKRPKYLSYREPENLPSLDPDALRQLFDTHQPSDFNENWSHPLSQSFTNTQSTSNLDSLGDIIQKYTNATLDSIQSFNIPVEDTGSSQSVKHGTLSNSGILVSPVVDNTIYSESSVSSVEPSSSLNVQNTTSNTACMNVSSTEDLKNNNARTVEISGSGIQPNKKLSGIPSLSQIKNCEAHPEHLGFFSPSDLKVKDLPREIQHEDSVTFFNCMAPLVVQISVNVTSSARGSRDENSDYIGTDRTRYGTGFVGSVDDRIVKFRCKRPNCFFNSTPTVPSSRRSSVISSPISPNMSFESQSDNVMNSPQTSSSSGSKHFYYGGVTVHTSRHVIYDKTEADNAYVKFFYQKPGEAGVVHCHVAAIVGVNISQDHVTLHVMSHDKTLFNTLPVLLANVKSSYNEMLTSTMKSQYSHSIKSKESWVAVISHPHGLSQAITFGRVKQEVRDSSRLNVKKYYDAPLCDGCSGALVMTPLLLKLQWPGAVHSSFDPDIGLNYTLDSRSSDLDFTDIGNMKKYIKK